MSSEDMKRKIDELNQRKGRISLGGGTEKIRKQHSIGKLTARERIDKLLDRGSFKEIDQFVHHRCTFFGMEKVEAPGDAIVTGHGKINGRDVFLFSQDFTVLGGTLGQAYASKIVKVMNLAFKMRAPIIGINNSGECGVHGGVT